MVHLKVAHTLVDPGVEVRGGRNTGLLCSLGKGIQNVPAQTLFFNAPFALVAVRSGKRRIVGLAFIQSPVAFVFFESGQHVVPAPRIIARQLCPLVVITRLAAHVDHAVDAGAAAQCFATWIAQAASVEPGIWFCLIEPVCAWVANAVQVTNGDVDPVVIVFATRFEQ